MKTKILSVACFAALTFSPMVWGMGNEYNDYQKSAEVANETIKASGTVKSIPADHLSIRIFHNPITALNWPAMNMPFYVADHGLVDSLQIGDKVNFEFVQKEGKNVIVKISK